MPIQKGKNSGFWSPPVEFQGQMTPKPVVKKKKKKRVGVIEPMPTAQERAAQKKALEERKAAEKKKTAIKETIGVLLSFDLKEKSTSPDSNFSLLKGRRIPASLQQLLTLAFPLSEEASNAQLVTLKAQTDALLEPLLLRDRAYFSEEEEDNDNHLQNIPYFRSEATITEFTITEFCQQEKILKATFEAFWESNHLGFFVSKHLDFVPIAPSCMHIETLSDLHTCSSTLTQRIAETHAILKDWEESKKMLSRPDPEWEEEERKVIALKEKLIFIKNRVDELIEHCLFRSLSQAFRRILLAEANHSIARQRRETEDKREAETVNEVPKRSKTIPISFEFPRPVESKEIHTPPSKVGFWMGAFLFAIAFIASIFLALELTTEWLALSTITLAAIPILIGITAFGWTVGILSAFVSRCRNDRDLMDKRNIVDILPAPTHTYFSEPFPETPRSFSQQTLKEKEKENSNDSNGLNASNTVNESALTFF